MLVELRVRNLGVIEDAALLLGPGLTALTGETGAGKTLVVEALSLLAGGRADAVLVRPGADEAVVEGRFLCPTGDAEAAGGERTLARVLARSGRSRAYLDGRMVPVATLGEVGRDLIELHGQHAYHSLLSPVSQREALDRAGRIDTRRLRAALRAEADLSARQAALGGDERSRAREIALLRYQLEEIDGAGLSDPAEEDQLREREARLAGAVAHRQALQVAREALGGEDGALDRLGAALAALAGRPGLERGHARLRGLAAEVADAAEELRLLGEEVEDDPGALSALGERRHVLAELRRKYGETLAEVIGYGRAVRARLVELESHEERAAALEAERAALEAERHAAAAELGAARRQAAAPFGAAVEARLVGLALPRARFSVDVDGDAAGERVTWRLGTNPGEPALPLARAASGGELARTMLAVRLALSDLHAGDPEGAGGVEPGRDRRTDPELARRTVVFDEVDAGIGGQAALAVGAALADVAVGGQVLVVTHLPQVAAFATRQVVVSKTTVRSGGDDGSGEAERTVATVAVVEGAERVSELARMLSGRPDSATARLHAEELLARADPAPAPAADGAEPHRAPGGADGSRVRARRRAAR